MTYLPIIVLFPVIGTNALWASYVFCELFTLLALFILITAIKRKRTDLSGLFLLPRTSGDAIKAQDLSVENTAEAAVAASEKLNDFCRESGVTLNMRFHVCMAVEEMLMMVNQFALDHKKKNYSDVRLTLYENKIIIRIRDIGKHFNPVEYYYKNKDSKAGFLETLGVHMVLEMAKNVEYRETYGVNNLIITIVN
jgi:anti-sigma regulatory factor (Ser/Thr protein kinase)